MNTSTIDFNKEKVDKLRKEYNKARANNKTQFVFEGKDILVDYAKYLLEYLDSRFPSVKKT